MTERFPPRHGWLLALAVILAAGCSWAVRSGGAVGPAAEAPGGPLAASWLLVGCAGGSLAPGPLAGSWRLVGCPGAHNPEPLPPAWILVGCTGGTLSPGPLPGSWRLGCPRPR